MRRRLSDDVDGAIVATGAESPVRDCFDVFFVNGYLTGDETALQSWGFHPTNRWYFRHRRLSGRMTSFACGRAYVVDWESELLRGLSSLFVDTAVWVFAGCHVGASGGLLPRHALRQHGAAARDARDDADDADGASFLPRQSLGGRAQQGGGAGSGGRHADRERGELAAGQLRGVGERGSSVAATAWGAA